MAHTRIAAGQLFGDQAPNPGHEVVQGRQLFEQLCDIGEALLAEPLDVVRERYRIAQPLEYDEIRSVGAPELEPVTLG